MLAILMRAQAVAVMTNAAFATLTSTDGTTLGTMPIDAITRAIEMYRKWAFEDAGPIVNSVEFAPAGQTPVSAVGWNS